MAKLTVFIIRHAEKPSVDSGIDSAGAPDGKSLTPRGWQRAGAWAEFFAPSLDRPSVLPRPTALYASAPEKHHESGDDEDGSKSRRPLETLAPLAAKLASDPATDPPANINLDRSKGDEADLATDISKMTGVVLVCWQHEDIPAIANALTSAPDLVPQSWPSDRFNVIFKLDRPDPSAPWEFEQLAPVLLAGDSSSSIESVPEEQSTALAGRGGSRIGA